MVHPVPLLIEWLPLLQSMVKLSAAVVVLQIFTTFEKAKSVAPMVRSLTVKRRVALTFYKF